MRLPHAPEALDALRTPTASDPLRVLVSGCLMGLPCGVEGDDYGLGRAIPDLLALPTMAVRAFCPEDFGLGTPRTMPDIHGGDGYDVLAGRARVLDPTGRDLTDGMLRGARAMLACAQEHRTELAILTDMSAACGTQVISDGDRSMQPRKFQMGVGVAAALLLEHGVLVVSQRDFHSLGRLRAKLDPGFVPDPNARDHHQHPWTVEHFKLRPKTP